MNTYVSNLGWLCSKLPNNRTIPICKLTDEQIKEFNDVQKLYEQCELRVRKNDNNLR